MRFPPDAYTPEMWEIIRRYPIQKPSYVLISVLILSMFAKSSVYCWYLHTSALVSSRIVSGSGWVCLSIPVVGSAVGVVNGWYSSPYHSFDVLSLPPGASASDRDWETTKSYG